jgi:hypothetical protein
VFNGEAHKSGITTGDDIARYVMFSHNFLPAYAVDTSDPNI